MAKLTIKQRCAILTTSNHIAAVQRIFKLKTTVKDAELLQWHLSSAQHEVTRLLQNDLRAK